MRNLMKYVLAAVFSAGIIGTASAQGGEANSKVLRVGCDGAFAPFTYINDKGELIGFDLDLIRAIAKATGYEVSIKSYPFDGIIPTLMTGTIDLIISGFTISPERAERVNFSEPYYKCGLTFLVKKEFAEKYKSLADLDHEEVCVQIGTSGAMFLTREYPNIKVKQFNTPPDTYIELQNNGCRVVLNDKPVNDYFLAHYDKDDIVSHRVSDSDEEFYGIAVNKQNYPLLRDINRGLELVHQNGEFARISTEWFGYDISDDLNRTVSAELKGLENK